MVSCVDLIILGSSNGGSNGTGSNGGSRSSNAIVGRFIWDWADQCLMKREVGVDKQGGECVGCVVRGVWVGLCLVLVG